MSNDTNQHGLTDDELGGRLRRAAWGLSRPPSTPTARQRSVMPAAAPLAQPQRRDAEFGGALLATIVAHPARTTAPPLVALQPGAPVEHEPHLDTVGQQPLLNGGPVGTE